LYRAAISGISVLAVLLALFCCMCYSVVFLSEETDDDDDDKDVIRLDQSCDTVLYYSRPIL